MNDHLNQKTPLIIAEVGVNHNGNLDQARRLVDVAASSGANIVKFQTFDSNKLVTSVAPQASYQLENTGQDQSQLELLRSLELTHEMHIALIEYCRAVGIEFLSTAFDVTGLYYLVKLGVRRIKIPSGELTNLPYLEAAASFKLPVIMSTGMATMSEIIDSCEVLYRCGLDHSCLTILHCTTNYPAFSQELNMKAVNTIRVETGAAIGYSDHSNGEVAAIMAVALGATVIEKHITLSKTLAGPDHQASMEPDSFRSYVASIKNAYLALGDGVKRPSKSEISNSIVVRKSIVASKDIYKGDLLSIENLTTKRPADGLSPMRWHEVLGTRAKRRFQIDEKIEI